MPQQTRTIQITLPQDVAHLIEVQAAKDNMRLTDGIERLLIYMAATYRESREKGGCA